MSPWEGLNPPYSTIVADPPWPFAWKAGAGGRRRRATTLGYTTMTLDAIVAMPVGDLVSDEAHLYLWATREIHRDSVQDWRQHYDSNHGKGHSRKPIGAFDLIQAASPGPYVELFSRSPLLGWDSWGHGYEMSGASA